MLRHIPNPKFQFLLDETVRLLQAERGRHVCPLRFPEVLASTCPVGHKNWAKSGCTTTLPTSIGARIRRP